MYIIIIIKGKQFEMMHCYEYNVDAATTPVTCAEDTFNFSSLAGGLIFSNESVEANHFYSLIMIIFSVAFHPFMVLRPFEKPESGAW